MRAIIEPPPEPGDPLPAIWKRLAWFVGLAVAGSLSVMAVAYLLKALLR
ncbi:hypothetical protein M9M90_19720 [Phenylobacterium sp. LH3H17]|nr:hypothetical protein [Phenylobacterium sp. LH3H17]UTP39410.1 hypothetical protein M9M90_19720 [Phenylobacterium sp. LH3H17]